MFKACSWRGVLDTTLCDKVCYWLVTGQWFSPGTPVSSTNKTDRHDIANILLKVALSTINQTCSHKNSVYIYLALEWTFYFMKNCIKSCWYLFLHHTNPCLAVLENLLVLEVVASDSYGHILVFLILKTNMSFEGIFD